MAKKIENTQAALGLAFSLPAVGNTFASYELAISPARALTKTEEKILIEAHKHQLVMEMTAGKTRLGEHYANELIHQASTEFMSLMTQLNAINEAAKGTPIQLLVEAFNVRLTGLGVDSLYAIAKAGITQIYEIVNTPLYMKDIPEEKRSLILRLLGG